MKRYQRHRTAGWVAPPGVVYVGRPTRFGNPFKYRDFPGRTWRERNDAAVAAFEHAVEVGDPRVPSKAVIREHLAGKDLMCWCSELVWCHADVLIRIANEVPE